MKWNNMFFILMRKKCATSVVESLFYILKKIYHFEFSLGKTPHSDITSRNYPWRY